MTNLSLSGIRFHPQNWTFRFPIHTAIDYFLSGLDWVLRFPADLLIRCRVPFRWTLERKADRCQRIFQKTKILRPRSLSAEWTLPILWLTPRHEICRFTRREAHRPLVKQDVKPTSLFPQDATIFFGRITGKIVFTAWIRFVLCRSRYLSGLAVRLVFDQAHFVTYIPMAERCEHRCKAVRWISDKGHPLTSPPPRCSSDTYAWVYSQESILARSWHDWPLA